MFTTTDRKIPVIAALVIASAAAGFCILRYATSLRGPALSNDSAIYLIAAQGVCEHRGLCTPGIGEYVPMTAYPPLFPLAIAAVGQKASAMVSAASLFNAVMLAFNVVLVALLIGRAGSPWAAAIGSAFVATAPVLLNAHGHIWSEPMSLAFLLASLMTLAAYRRNPSLWLVGLFCILAAGASMTRYVGVAILPVGMVAFFWWGQGSLRKRLAVASLATLAGGLPLAVWFIRNFVVTGNATNRSISVRIPDISSLRELPGDLTHWFLQHPLPAWLRAGVFLAIAVVFFVMMVAFVRKRLWGVQPVPTLMLVFMVAYEAVVLAATCMLDVSILADLRLQIPLFVACVVFMLSAGPLVLQPMAFRALTGVALLFVGINIVSAIAWASVWHAIGNDYTSLAQSESPIMARVRELPPEVPIYSNLPFLIYAQTGRVAWLLPSRTTFTRIPSPAYEDDWNRMRTALAREPGYIVEFGPPHGAYTTATPIKDVTDRLNVKVVATESDGTILTLAQR